jgi:hypothetical protein
VKHLIDLLRTETSRRSDPVQFAMQFVEHFAQLARQHDHLLAVDTVDQGQFGDIDAAIFRLDGEIDGLQIVSGADHQGMIHLAEHPVAYKSVGRGEIGGRRKCLPHHRSEERRGDCGDRGIIVGGARRFGARAKIGLSTTTGLKAR